MKELNIRNYKSRSFKWLLFTILLMFILTGAILLSLSVGEITIPLWDIPGILENGQSIEYTILQKIRFPRILLGLAVGGSLSLAGVCLQGIYRNPLVEPYTLGISGGAALGVALVIIFGLHRAMGSFMLPFFGFIGSLVIIVLIYTLSSRGGRIHMQRMLLIGVMISFIMSSVMMFLMAITSAENLHGIIFWMMGSLDEPNLTLIQVAFGVSVAGLILSYFFARPLNALRLGEAKARHLGINTEISLRALFIMASLLTGISVAVAGVIGFVGLIIPHLARLIVGTDYRILLISSFLGGGAFVILSDLLARTVIAPNELPIGVITGIIGGTVFVVVLSRNNMKTI